jgi:hypothetical protein
MSPDTIIDNISVLQCRLGNQPKTAMSGQVTVATTNRVYWRTRLPQA